MVKLKFYLVNVVLFLVVYSKALYGQDTTIVGKAVNAKYGALVVTTTEDGYYIDKLESWSPEMKEKTVRVTGKLIIKKIKKTKAKTISGRITGQEIKIIRRPKIQLVSST
jgi:hypothetical protein